MKAPQLRRKRKVSPSTATVCPACLGSGAQKDGETPCELCGGRTPASSSEHAQSEHAGLREDPRRLVDDAREAIDVAGVVVQPQPPDYLP